MMFYTLVFNLIHVYQECIGKSMQHTIAVKDISLWIDITAVLVVGHEYDKQVLYSRKFKIFHQSQLPLHVYRSHFRGIKFLPPYPLCNL